MCLQDAGSVSSSSVKSSETPARSDADTAIIWINPSVSAVLYIACLSLQVCIAIQFYTSPDNTEQWWGVTFLCLTLIPTIAGNMTSGLMVYLHMDFSDKFLGRLLFYGLHVLLLGPLWRQSKIVITRDHKDVQELHLLCLFQAGFSVGPFLALISYWMLVTTSYNAVHLSTAVTSLIFIVLTFSNHTEIMNISSGNHGHSKRHHHLRHVSHQHQTVLPRKYAILSPFLRFCWRLCMLSSRILSIVTFMVFAKFWILLVIFAHWLLMVTGSFLASKMKPSNPHYQNRQHSTSCTTHSQRYAQLLLQMYDILRFSQQCRLLSLVVFYVLMLIENVIMSVTWFASDLSKSAGDYRVLLLVVIFLAFLLGFLFMLLNETICYNNRQLCTQEISAHVCCVNAKNKDNIIRTSMRNGLMWDSCNDMSTSNIIKPYVNKSYIHNENTENIKTVCESEVHYPNVHQIHKTQGYNDLGNSLTRTSNLDIKNLIASHQSDQKARQAEFDVLSTAELIVQDLSLDLNLSHDARSSSKATDRSSNTGGASSNSRNTNTLDVSFHGDETSTISPGGQYKKCDRNYRKWCYRSVEKKVENEKNIASSTNIPSPMNQYTSVYPAEQNCVKSPNHKHKFVTKTDEENDEVYGTLSNSSYDSCREKENSHKNDLYFVDSDTEKTYTLYRNQDISCDKIGYKRIKGTPCSASSSCATETLNDQNETHHQEKSTNLTHNQKFKKQLAYLGKAPSIYKSSQGSNSYYSSWKSSPISYSSSDSLERERSPSRQSPPSSWRESYTTDYSSESTSYYHGDYTVTCDSDTSYFADSDSEFAMTWPPSNHLTRYNIINLPKNNVSTQEHVKSWLNQIHTSVQTTDRQIKEAANTKENIKRSCHPRRFSMQNLEVKDFVHKVKPRTALKAYLSRLCTVGQVRHKLCAHSVDNFGYFGTKYLHSKKSQTHQVTLNSKKRQYEGMESLV